MGVNTKIGNMGSFTAKILFKADEAYVAEPSKQMFDFFGTTADSYKKGIIARIRNDIGEKSADMIINMLRSKSENGEDFRLVYPSKRADGSECIIQLDAYAGEKCDSGIIYNCICMDISEMVKAQESVKKLAEENTALMEDSPIGLGVYHIRGNSFELVYTNREYYAVHCGSREYWDSFKGKDAINRIVEEDRQFVFDEWKKTLDDPKGHVYNACYRCVGEDGKIHWIRLLARMSDAIHDGVRICYASYLNIDKEKQAEEKAAHYNKEIIDTINHLPMVSLLCVIKPGGIIKIESFSDDFCKMVGCTQENIWNLYTEDAYFPVHPDDREGLRLFFEKKAGNIDKWNSFDDNFTYRIITKSGIYKWVSVKFSVFNVGDKKYNYVVYTDIDDLKKQEQLHERQYISAQSYLDSISDTFIATMRVNLSQNKVEMINGTDPLIKNQGTPSYDDVFERVLLSLPRLKDREAFKKAFAKEHLLRGYDEGKNIVSTDYLVKSDDCRAMWVRCTMTITKKPGTSDIIAFSAVSDINRNKVIEMIMSNIITTQYDFISVIDANLNSIELISVNYQSTYADEVHGGDDYDAIMHAYIEKNVVPEERNACIEFMTLSNVIKNLESNGRCTASFNVNEAGINRNKRLDYAYIDRESRLITLIRTDYTQMQKQQLEQEDKLRSALNAARQASVAKSEFLSRMSHEIRTPMNAIIGLDTIALQEKGLSSSMEDHLKKIGISARFLLSLINDILDMSRIESGKMLLSNKEFDFRRLIDNINAILYAQCMENGIDYECVIKGYTEESYVGDELKLQQVILNILGNSVKFTPAGGKIHFMIEQISHDRERARLRFTMADTGKGIDEKFMPHIFDTFSQEDCSRTTTYGGTGLGLAICKNLINLMDGSIDVHSIKGMGTDFNVEVSLGLSDRTKNWNKSISSVNVCELKTLIVDDDVIVCRHTEIVLAQAGIKAEWVESGMSAVEKVTLRHAQKNDYNLILIDWKMPDMDGIETARRIRKIVGRDVTIVILTAYDWSEIELKAREAGVDSFIRKPVFVSSVLQAYDETMSKNINANGIVPSGYNFSGKKVLLVEDNLINLEIAESLLRMVGFSVDTAVNGIEAIRKYTDSKDNEYSAILMDIRMPLMDGLEASKVIRLVKKADAGTVPIIALSANAFEEDIHKSLSCGMNAHLTKPIEADKMYETLDRLIRDRKM